MSDSPRWRVGDDPFQQFEDDDMEEDLEEASDDEDALILQASEEQTRRIDNLADEKGVELVDESQSQGTVKRQRTASPPSVGSTSQFSSSTAATATPPPSHAAIAPADPLGAVDVVEKVLLIFGLLKYSEEQKVKAARMIPGTPVEKRAQFLSIIVAKLCDKLRFGAEDRNRVEVYFQSRPAARCQELVTTKLVPLLLQAEKGQLQVHPQSQAAAQQQQRHAQQQQAAAQITQVAQQQQMAQKMQAILPQLQQVVGMPPMLPGLPGSPGLPGMPPGMPAHNVVQQMQGPRVQEELQRQNFLQRQLRVQQLARQAAERRQAKEDAERQDLEDDGVIVNNSYDATSSALLEQEELEEDEAQAKEVVFAHYAPRKVVYGNLHRDALVESSVMASIEPPDPTHVPSLPESLLYGERGRVTFSRGAVWQAHEPNALSAAQLEAVVYAGQRHAQHNGDGTRCGFFIGDGTGVGKGREIGAVILDNMRRGRLRHIWCSVSTTLLLDCKRDLEDLGRKDIELYPLHKLPYGDLPGDIEDGIMFCTYASLIAKNKSGQSRLDQLIAWTSEGSASGCQRDFEGCLVFDEAHRAKNLVSPDKGKSSKTAEAVLKIQQKLPNSRVLYVSATAAAETKDFGYMTRLGLWGTGAPFCDFDSFAKEIKRAGMSAMELVAMDMKARGMFVSRMLSFEGCTFEKRECILSSAQRELYDAAVEWWERLLTGFERCATLTQQENKQLRSFWGSHQSFFKQLLNSLKASFAIEAADEGIAQGYCVVIGLLSTGEAKANEAAEREAREGRELDAEVSTPHEIALAMIERHLPKHHFHTHQLVPEAQRVHDQLLARLESIRMPGNALDLLTSHFGVDRVAEMTGRKSRSVVLPSGKVEWQPRAPSGVSHEQLNINEKTAFISGDKPVAIISDAASSGISLHADQRFANTKRRLHITLELAWSAEKMLQQFGRTHRSNQVTPPHYLLLVTDVGGEQRFASSVARRIEMLGAMTRGDRRGGHGAYADLSQYNLDTPQAHMALALMLDAVSDNADRDNIWDEALRMLRCTRDGVPTLLGLAIISLTQKRLKGKLKQVEYDKIPYKLREYNDRLVAWSLRNNLTAAATMDEDNSSGSNKTRVRERAEFGTCPKTPLPELTWLQTGQALARMKLLTPDRFSLAADKFTINQFLNRLLGLPVDMQNGLFAYFRRVFRWVIVAERQQGKLDSGVALIQGETIEQLGEPEVVYCDTRSSAVTTLLPLRVDTGLSWKAACTVLDDGLRDHEVKSTDQGGFTGFWRQKRSKQIYLALEQVASAPHCRNRTYRILGPKMHTSAKPRKYVPCAGLREKYECVRSRDAAREIWEKQHEAAAEDGVEDEEDGAKNKKKKKPRLQDVSLLCGAILPLWPALSVATASSKSLPVKKCTLDGVARVGVALGPAGVVELRKQLLLLEGGRGKDIEEARQKLMERNQKRSADAARARAQRAKAAAAADAPADAAAAEEDDSSSSSEESSGDEGPGLSFAAQAAPVSRANDASYDDDEDEWEDLLGSPGSRTGSHTDEPYDDEDDDLMMMIAD